MQPTGGPWPTREAPVDFQGGAQDDLYFKIRHLKSLNKKHISYYLAIFPPVIVKL